MNLCSLQSYKKRILIQEKIQIIILIKKDEFKIEIYKSFIDLSNKDNYYGLGLKGNKTENELILLEEVYINSITKANAKHNIVDFCFKNPEIKEKNKKNKKNENIKDEIDIMFDFSSSVEAKSFLSSIRDMAKKYKEKYHKGKKK